MSPPAKQRAESLRRCTRRGRRSAPSLPDSGAQTSPPRESLSICPLGETGLCPMAGTRFQTYFRVLEARERRVKGAMSILMEGTGVRPMKLKDILTKDPEVINPDAMICEAARKMKECDIGMLPVCDGDRLVGAITDRDLAVRAIAEGRDPLSTKVRDVMTPGICYGFEDEDLE